MRDFTLRKYSDLIDVFLESGYVFSTMEDICKKDICEPFVVMRHDVDRMPHNALRMAELEYDKGIRATYYFRIQKKVFDESIIKKISLLKHEVGYHFEDLSSAHGDVDEAIVLFRKNLERMRKVVPVNTVSMHGKPLSRFDNRKLILSVDFKEMNILCEPYSIVEKLGLLYFTDTGRSWNNDKVNMRDRTSHQFMVKPESTDDFMQMLKRKPAGENMMVNIHPERWDDRIVPWISGAVLQKIKNVVKFVLVRLRNGN
ncbi:MAG: hypothetical protein GXO47_01150 [Chlorobi bacterium]|nr:hypothetical protein [Chlorobiota bacterium]